MLRYAFDEILSKTFDYFLKDNNNRNNHNQNRNYNQLNSRAKFKAKNRNSKTSHQVGLYAHDSDFEQLDWFGSLKKDYNSEEEEESKRRSSQTLFNSLYYNDLLNSFFETEKLTETSQTNTNIPHLSIYLSSSLPRTLSKMTLHKETSSDTTNNSNTNLTTSYLDNETDIELVNSLKSNSLKAVRVFQKPYYQEEIKGELIVVPSWRMKEKLKTVSAALVMCLNIGVDPPDVVKTSQCSKLECWKDQTSNTPQKALEMIGIELQKQYERWQPRARYKHCLDPTSDDVKKLCVSLRKNAKDERVLFHYNGHGVPKPTSNGEIWVFNKEFTQYIPLSLYEVQTWMGSPSLYVWDCSNAGLIIQTFLQFEEDRENEFNQRSSTNVTGTTTEPSSNASSVSHNLNLKVDSPLSTNTTATTTTPSISTTGRIRDSIHLAACGRSELLPIDPNLPLDLFTACLTTPIKAALHWYISQKNACQLIPGLTLDLLEKIPGQINDRKTMMGELNWIFTAITDTIAWNVLDSDLFQKLFRQDLLVASLFRNFLLAERIMKSLDCTPQSHPRLPATNEHPLWQSWDLALEMCISQLPYVVQQQQQQQNHFNPQQQQPAINDFTLQRDFISCGFFAEQIEIFDVWLRYNVNSHNPPEQLPVVLQVLLSQQHRLKALELLGKFLDFGPWAVSAALSVGIFPYVLKLLTTQPRELRPLLTFIWAKILAVDKSCQAELVKDSGDVYFISVLGDHDVDSTQKVYSAFVLSCLIDDFPLGQESAKQHHLIATCSYLFTTKQSKDYRNPLLRQWCCICLGLCWQKYAEARWEGVRNNAHQYLIELINDPVPEVRAAAIFALGTYIGCGQGNEGSIDQTYKLDSEIVNALIKDYDIVGLVRKELIIALYNYVNQFIVNNQNQSQSYILNSTVDCGGGDNLASPRLSLTNHESSKTSTPTITNTTTTNGNATNNAAGDSVLLTSSQQPNLPKSLSSTSFLTKSPIVVSNNSNKHQQNLASPILTQSTSMMSGVSTAAAPTSLLGAPSNLYTRSNSISSTSISANSTNSMSQQYQSSKDLFNKVWMLLADMQNDPDPGVAELAFKVISYFMTQLNSFDSRKQQFILDQKPLRSSLLSTSPSQQQQAATTTTITTEFVPWCCKYFLKPLLSTQHQHQYQNQQKHNQVNTDLFTSKQVDIYASEFLDQHCKLLYNHKVKRKTPPKWSEPQTMNEILQIKHALKPIHCKFHPYDDQLFVVDKDSNINVYETQMNNKLKLSFSIFQNQSSNSSLNSLKPPPTVTSFNLINVQHEPMFLTGTDDRIVRIFKPDLVNYTSSGTRLVTAFKVFDDKKKQSSNIEVGLIVEWDEPNEILLCSGDTKYIRVWDMNKELYKDYSTQAVSCVSSLTTHQNYTVAGFGDGTIKLFDFRISNSNVANIQQPMQMNGRSTSTQIYQHNSLVLKVKIHKPSMKLITSSTNGDVNLWDLRSLQACLKTSMNNEQATAVECHPVNELIAVANSNFNQNQSVKVFDFQARELACIKHHQGFVGRRISTVTCLDWNSYKNQMVFGSQDNFITMFSCKDNKD